jgi:hypothetical protein
MRKKVTAPQSKGDQKLKKNPPNTTNVGSQNTQSSRNHHVMGFLAS